MSYVVTISGSPAAQSRSAHLLSVAELLLRAAGLTVRRINVRDLPATPLLHADAAHPALRAAIELVENAQAVVIATPVYKVSYSGILKTFLDLLPQTGLAGKVVLPIATGGSLAHLLALDYALKPVLSALGARHVVTSVFGTDREVIWGDEGAYTLSDEIAARLAQSVGQLHGVLTEQAELRAYRLRQQEHAFAPASNDAPPADAAHEVFKERVAGGERHSRGALALQGA